MNESHETQVLHVPELAKSACSGLKILIEADIIKNLYHLKNTTQFFNNPEIPNNIKAMVAQMKGVKNLMEKIEEGTKIHAGKENEILQIITQTTSSYVQQLVNEVPSRIKSGEKLVKEWQTLITRLIAFIDARNIDEIELEKMTILPDILHILSNETTH